MAVLKLPIPLLNRAKAPLAVFWKPVVLDSRAAVPLAVFSVPVVLNKSAAAPVAVFESAVLRSSAPAPTAGVEAASGDAKQRKRTKRCVPTARSESLKGVVPRSSGEVGIAPRGWRADRLRSWQTAKIGQGYNDED